MSAAPSFLIIRFSSIGDIILTTAFVRQLRQSVPGACITYVTKREFGDLLRHNPHVERLIGYDSATGVKGLTALREELAGTHWDAVFDLHNNQRSHWLSHQLNYKSIRRIDKNRVRRALLVYAKLNTFAAIPSIPERYRKVGEEWGVKDDGGGLELFWPPELEERLDAVIPGDLPLIALAPGAGFYTKMWPLDYWRKLLPELLAKYPHRFVLIGGPDERKMLKPLEIDARVVNLAGKLSLLESAALIRRAGALICNDSGVMHMASAVGTPMVAVFGSTTRHLGFFPFRARVEILENNHQWCRPCSHVGRPSCPLVHFNCMRAISPDRVQKALFRLLEDG